MYIDYMVYLNEKGGKETEFILAASRGDMDLMQIDISRIHQEWRITTKRVNEQHADATCCASFEADRQRRLFFGS